MCEINAKFQYPVWQSEENGYCIFLYRLESGNKVMVKGTNLPQTKELFYRFDGRWENSTKYGDSFAVDFFEPVIKADKESIVSYLCTINLIGKKTAERIYEKYGDKSVEILDKGDYDSLSLIKGISLPKAESIVKAYSGQRELNRLSYALKKYGIAAKLASKIYHSNLNLKSMDAIKENPYKLFKISGVSINTCDAIAIDCMIPMNSGERIHAHALSIMFEQEQSGSTGITCTDFGVKLIKNMAHPSINRQTVTAITVDLIKEGLLICRKMTRNNITTQYLFRKSRYLDDQELAKEMVELSRTPAYGTEDLEVKIDRICEDEHIVLDNIQKQAVYGAIKNHLYIITGFPGTGKTTVIKVIAKYLSLYEKKPMFFMAHAGKAARRIKESTGYESQTLCSFLGLRPDEEYTQEKDDELGNCTIFVDEFSMVDLIHAKKLFDRATSSCRIVIIGDKDQLQSIGAGAVLRDMVNSRVIPLTMLTNIHRQSGGSIISKNAKRIIEGNSNLELAPSFRIIKADSAETAEEYLVRRYVLYAKKYGIKNVYCIVPNRERTAGVHRLNNLLREQLNPLHPGDDEVVYGDNTYRIGDPVMHLKNEELVSNGDIGYVTDIVSKQTGKNLVKSLIVTYFGDTEKEYSGDTLEEIQPAYAFTVHKSQGSESPIVLTYISEANGKALLTRNLFFTAVTRAANVVEIFTESPQAIKTAIDNPDSERRITSLEYHLRYYGGNFVAV